MVQLDLNIELLIKTIRYHMFYSILLSGLLILLTPVFYGLTELNYFEAAHPLEMYASLTGILLFAPLLQPEEEQIIKDVVWVKKRSYRNLCTIRIGIALTVVIILTGLLVGYMRWNGCDVSLITYGATLADTILLGGIALFATVLSQHTIVGYMVSILCYLWNYGLAKKLGKYGLFSMLFGRTDGKWLLGLLGILFLAGALLSIRRKRY